MEFLATSTPKSATSSENTRKADAATNNELLGSKIRHPNPIVRSLLNIGKAPISNETSTKDLEVNKIAVAVRIRPISGREILNDGEKNVISIRHNALYLDLDPRKKANQYKFNVDHIFQSFDENDSTYSSQEKIYKTIGVPLLESAFKGYNACLLAYGQTGSGKSFSMMGRSEADIDSEEYSGLIPRFCRDLMDRKNNLPDNCTAALNISYFEIYNEKIYDLLSAEDIQNRNTLKVRENPISGPYVENLSVKTVKTYDELRLWLLIGNKNRAIAATHMNEQSSRSHSIFKVELNFLNGLDNDNKESRSRRSSVSLVDLAGNERLVNDKKGNADTVPRTSKSNKKNKEKQRESVSINKSLLNLGLVISSLADKKSQFVPYRDSVLTWLLKESIGGNSLTTMLATITPSSLYVEETLATLRYACKAKLIVNRAQINENPQEKLIRELKMEVSKLKLMQRHFETAINSDMMIQETSTGSTKDLEKLKIQLDLAENKLAEAELSWEQKFAESNAAHRTSLIELENLKEELESKIRIMSDSAISIDLTLYKSNFLEELESVLEEEVDSNISEKFSSILGWCRNNNVNYYLTAKNDFILTDYKNKKQTTITINDLDSLVKYKTVDDMMTDITWNSINSKNVIKEDFAKSINVMYRSLANILPPVINKELEDLYESMSKLMQNYEIALMSTIQ